MDIDDLRAVQSKERRKDSLQHLRDSFYDDVAAYIADRRERRDARAASVDKPFSDSEVRRLSDEIETAEEVAESLYERRVGKVVKLASFAAADAPVDTDGMTTQELDLFDDLVARIRENKESVLDVLADGPDAGGDDAADDDVAEAAGDAAAPEAMVDAAADPDADATPDPDPNADAAGTLADAMGGESVPGSASDGDAAADASEPGTDAAAGETETADSGADPTAAADGTVPRPDPDESAGTGEPSPPSDSDSGPGPDTEDGTATDEPAVAVAAGDADDPPAGATDPDPAGGDAEGAADAGTDPAAGADDDRTTVRITRDVGRILGVDEREYDLEPEDVVALPAANAGPLVERDAAEPLE